MAENRERENRKVATIGTFDGLHRGHERVISKLREISTSLSIPPLIICFDRHPLETLAPHRAPALIQSAQERTEMLRARGLDTLVVEFTPALASLTAREWLGTMHSEYGVDALVLGYDNTFGSDGRHMNLEDYESLGHDLGVKVFTAPYESHVSSSAIRRLVAEGNVEEAATLLGRPFDVTGIVSPGKKLGRTIGFPTANVEPQYRALMPANGVYGVEVLLPDGATLPAVANVGVQPTVSADSHRTLEVHIPGFDGNLYGQLLTVKFMRRLRDEMKFSTINELKLQIKKDIEAYGNYQL